MVKHKKILLVTLFAFMILGVLMISYARFSAQVEKENQHIRNSGQSLVKMVSLAYDRNFEPLDHSFFFRELTHLVSNREIDYFVIQRPTQEAPIISFFREDIQQEIPDAVRLNALSGKGFQVQEFTLANGSPFLEFNKPVFKEGIPEVVVRLGKAQVSKTFLTLDNFILPLQVIFFILMASVCGYYWFYLLLKPFGKLIPAGKGISTPDPQGANVQALVGELELFFDRTRERISSAEQEGRQLTAKIQVLEYENNQLFHIFNCLDFGILMVDIKDMVFFINDYFLTLLNLDRKEVMDHSFFDLPDHAALKSFVQQQTLMEQGLDTAGQEVDFPHGHPDQFYRASVQSLTGPDGTLFGRLVKVVNITREKRSEKSQQDFTNHIAHELRTPLTNIKAYNEMMMEGEITNLEMQKEFFNTINDETNRLDQLIRSILKLAETGMGPLSVKRELVKSQWLVQSCMDAVTAFALEKNIRLTTQLPDHMPTLSGDKEMLKAALINVLGNAVKYTPESGTVRFSLQETPETVLFEVQDTGFGISQADLPHIFEKFFRSQDNQVAEQTGNGLGLAITAEIINNHQGFIEVTSETGKGSNFMITLPKGDLRIG